MKVKCLLLLYLFAFVSKPLAGQTTHLFLAADLNINPHGMESMREIEQMKQLFEVLSNRIKYDFKPILFIDGKFKATAIRDQIQKTEFGKSDLIVFYYSGDIHFVEEESLPYLALKDFLGKSLSVREINELIWSKTDTPRALVMIQNGHRDPPAPRGEEAPELTLDPVMLATDSLIISKMFLKKCGITTAVSHRKSDSTNQQGGLSARFTQHFNMNLITTLNYSIDTLELSRMFQIDRMAEHDDTTAIDMVLPGWSVFEPCQNQIQMAAMEEETPRLWSMKRLKNEILNLSELTANSTTQSIEQILVNFESPESKVKIETFRPVRNNRLTRVATDTLTIEQYLTQMAGQKKIMDIEIVTNTMQLTPSLKKIKYLEINQIYK